MFRKNNQTGNIGEQLAIKYLQNKKVSIVARNYRKKFGEVDIIAQQNNELIFVEVKTRTSNFYGSPAEAVTIQKQRQIIRVAQSYLAKHDLFDTNIRFDVISILLSANGQHDIQHIENAFQLQQTW